ncbi:DNA primase [Nitrosomonas cryotolerans]|uniref:DNA primase n=1 Tax=Nitrosomonas cryotolerans ATCC 49181 TaxID=1131553 RepID=A0A1N6G8H9_9PROT|nr:DNA primase [Nitrosomonas cryotolerans]SFP51325.1 DNA primase [Nitrosomonas cryotolerans]SIO03817.1 DNA primase [Nitrosomonas cryotolerans ATCC 49181]
MIPQSFIHDLLGRSDIIDVIDRVIPLKKAGANYIACCPFHSEKTPSFTVSPAKQFYHCFGCGAHGNVISFLMEYNGRAFVEAVGDLAAQAGMEVPAEQADSYSERRVLESGFLSPGMTDEENSPEAFSQRLYETIIVATRFYREQLKTSNEAIAYLKKRGLTGEIAARFAIGYAPAGWQNLSAAFPDYQSEATKKLLVQAGLMVKGDNGKDYDRFRNRIMFPILNQKARIIGFGGRILEQGEPKYLNTPETSLFEKGRELYNLFSAGKAIREAGRIVVVEGYMDVIALSQHGVNYVVAALGTAITDYHVQKLLRQTDNVIFCFDGDKAGKKAAWRALENSLLQLVDGKVIRFLFLPEGEDPDSYIHKSGKEAFEALIRSALPLSEFLFQTLLKGNDLKTSEGRAKLVRDAKPLIEKIAAPTLALMLIKRLAELTGASQNELEILLQIKRGSESSARVRPSVLRQQPVTPYYWLILILLYSPAYIQKLDRNLFVKFEEDNEEINALRALIAFLDVHFKNVGDLPAFSIATYFCDSPHRALLEKMESEMLGWKETIDLEAEFFGAQMKLREVQRKQRMTELHSKPLNMLTVEERKELQRLAVS